METATSGVEMGSGNALIPARLKSSLQKHEAGTSAIRSD